MNSKAVNFIKNFSYQLSSNLIVLIISVLVVTVIPKILGVQEYGYWQLYFLYTTLTGFLHFGWVDGIYQRYAGIEYDKLNKGLMQAQFWLLVIFELFITFTIIIIISSSIVESEKLFIIKMVLISSCIVIPRGMLLFILQGSNRIISSSLSVILGQSVYCLLIVLSILLEFHSYKMLILADLIGKLISFIYIVLICSDIVFGKITNYYININVLIINYREILKNINVGIKITIAYLTSTLIIGIVRFSIELNWDIKTFSEISLPLSISNLLMVFINALGIILFPILRRTKEIKFPMLYQHMHTLLIVPIIGLLIIYYPINIFMSNWLPQYQDSLKYMALLFPLVIFEGKMSLLVNTFLKTLRMEKQILIINLLSFCISLLLTFFIVIILKHLFLSVILILFLLAIRCLIGEIFISRILNISIIKDVFLTLNMTFIFIFTTLLNNMGFGILIYLVFYICYLIIKRKDIINCVKHIKLLVSK